MEEKRVFAVINQKGGSTKTTTAVNVAGALVALGRRVRVVDLDPQEGSTTHWIPPVDDVGEGLYEVFTDSRSLDDVTSKTQVPDLFVVPSYGTLRAVEKDRAPGSEMVLQAAMRSTTYPVDCDIFDCPHSLDVLAVAGVAAATDLIIPVQASALDVVGMGELLALADVVQRRLNPRLRIAAIVVGRTKGNAGFDANLLADFRARYPNAVVLPIADSVAMRRATNAHLPINVYEPAGKATADFRALAEALDPLITAGVTR